jgi:L-aminoadipate-semialdehyde dehydrogenase
MFFDLRRKWRGIDISMNAIFRSPTLKGFAGEIDRLLDIESFATSEDPDKTGAAQASNQPDDEYSKDARRLASELPETFPTRTDAMLASEPTIFLTGATGFLGAHILRDLLTRKSPSTKVVALVRAKSEEQALERIRSTCRAYGFWDDAWTSKLQALCGDLGKPQFGLSQAVWDGLTDSVDAVIHNGALVHWVYPYSTLKPANVMGTIDALKLCGSGKAKQFAFVSSTSALDKDHYVKESERSLAAGGNGISEEDDMEGSAVGLGTGYGQSKWAGEYLVKEAGRRGLRGTIIRSGYVLGDSTTGTTNTDDFLIRMMKGCIQLSARPNINNTVNMVPVDHVARIIIACAFHPPRTPVGVAHVTGHPRLRFNQFLGALQTYGYDVPQIDYVPWSQSLENYVNDGQHNDKDSQHALMPLYHFVTADLPSNTKAPELDDTNAAAALKADAAWSGIDASAGAGVTEELVGLYSSYLMQIGFLPAPTIAGAKPLPPARITEEQKQAVMNVGGRGGAA